MFVFGVAFSLSAETIILKSGQKVEGKIVDKSSQVIKVDVSGITLTYYMDDVDRIEQSQEAGESVQEKPSEDGLDIAINPMMELDFMTKSEVLDLRRSYVSQYPDLASPRYQPSESIFGQMQDKKAWWGIDGISCYGPGQRSIDGPSEETRFLVNPYLLLGVIESTAHIINGKNIACSANYPEAIKLFWHSSHDWAKATYDVSTYMKVGKTYRYSNADELYLVAYNARDLGFNYLYVDPDQTRGIDMSNISRQPVPLKQYIHCGGSCGYPGGCNNMSPTEPYMVIRVSSLPAWVYVKLWKRAPVSSAQQADMIFIIEMV